MFQGMNPLSVFHRPFRAKARPRPKTHTRKGRGRSKRRVFLEYPGVTSVSQRGFVRPQTQAFVLLASYAGGDACSENSCSASYLSCLSSSPRTPPRRPQTSPSATKATPSRLPNPDAHLAHGDAMGACQHQQTQDKQGESKQNTNSGNKKPQKEEKQNKGKRNNTLPPERRAANVRFVPARNPLPAR